jgi:peptidyl-prolyl cis-trans isomerase SDCCAG10
MSTRYALEPPTNGKVLVKTTHGDIHIDLWAREAPLASRNFVQLCLEGYFDNSPFYRVVLGFLVQVGPEERDESIFGKPFRDEFHSRLKFNHRGMVAMVNSKMNDNRSHFFITTDKAEYLFRKNSVFGKVANNSIYNVIRISEVDVDPSDRPLVMPRIIGTEVLENPFDDIIPREVQIVSGSDRNELVDVSRPTKKPTKILISYSDEESPTPLKYNSSHDVLTDPSLSKQSSDPVPTPSKPSRANIQSKLECESSEDEEFDLKMKKKLLAQKEIFLETQTDSSVQIGNYNVKFTSDKTIISKVPNAEEEFQDIKKNFLRLKSNPLGSNNSKVLQEEEEMKTFLTPLQKLQYQFHSYNKKTKGREQDTLSKLESFIEKVQKNEEKNSWLASKLKFSTDSSKAFAFNKDLPVKALAHEEEDKIVVDPQKRLKNFEDDYGDNLRNLQDILSHENLLKITNQVKK